MNSLSDLRVKTRSAMTGIASVLWMAPSPRKPPFSRVGVSTNSSCAPTASECFMRSHTAFSVGLGEVNSDRVSSMALCRSTNLKLDVVTVIGALSIWK